MKIRTDFVTNSSSSSFLLTFKDESSIFNTLKEQFPNVKNSWSAGEDGYLAQLLDEISNAPRLTKEEVKKLVMYESYGVEWKLENKLRKEKGMTYAEVRDFMRTEEGKGVLNEMLEEEADRVIKAIGDNDIVVEVEHGDGGEGEDGVLEHDILPILKCTVARFSHH